MVHWTWKENDYQTKRYNLSFFKVNILLGQNNCLLVQCIDGACWISLGVNSVLYKVTPAAHPPTPKEPEGTHARFRLHEPPPPPPPPSRERDIPPIRELVKALAITKHPFFWLSQLIFFRD